MAMYNNICLPCCSHPISVNLVDDDSDFLTDLSTCFSLDFFRYETSKSPKKLLAHLNKQYAGSPLVERVLQELPVGARGDKRIEVEGSTIYHEVKQLQRFERVGIVIVDVQMPEMDGVDFCKKLESPYIQKILLTGTLSETDAIKALNEGVVHQVLYKEPTNMRAAVQEALLRARWCYFAALTRGLYGANSPYNINSAPQDLLCEKLLLQEMQRCDAVEHYLCDPRGTFLLVDAQGNSHALFVRTAQQLQESLKTPQAQSANPQLLAQLQASEQMLCYFHPAQTRLPEGDQWEQYAHAASVFQGEQPLFYACVPNAIAVAGLAPFCQYEQPQDAMGKAGQRLFVNRVTDQ
ncbi:MAG: response regulator [Myxococcota bacterium]